ncbi:hypothetical protein PIB30_081627 [Stylosanthes scabra]|uniref:Uncharacterized protein n=1 Tax=Stylosanthes scabra TaxID=79078 RepID=A0ABU6YSJ1_9FABA|nr:hypothetical protein [Stylosanthes scabra]
MAQSSVHKCIAGKRSNPRRAYRHYQLCPYCHLKVRKSKKMTQTSDESATGRGEVVVTVDEGRATGKKNNEGASQQHGEEDGAACRGNEVRRRIETRHSGEP